MNLAQRRKAAKTSAKDNSLAGSTGFSGLILSCRSCQSCLRFSASFFAALRLCARLMLTKRRVTGARLRRPVGTCRARGRWSISAACPCRCACRRNCSYRTRARPSGGGDKIIEQDEWQARYMAESGIVGDEQNASVEQRSRRVHGVRCSKTRNMRAKSGGFAQHISRDR